METKPSPTEVFICVDVETAGPNPGQYSLLSIGACTVLEPRLTFYVEIKPVNMNFLPEALAISGFTMEGLAERGLGIEQALLNFETWVQEVIAEGSRPIFVAFNAAFDWMFVNDYFHRYLGRNPFGHAALDIKSYYMGLSGLPWSKTSMRWVGPRYHAAESLSHNALQDAIDQAEIFLGMLQDAKRASKPAPKISRRRGI